MRSVLVFIVSISVVTHCMHVGTTLWGEQMCVRGPKCKTGKRVTLYGGQCACIVEPEAKP